MVAQRGVEVELCFSFNFGDRWAWVVNPTHRLLNFRERPVTHCTGGWVGPSAGLDGLVKLWFVRRIV